MPVIVVLIVIAVAVVALVSVGRMLFGGDQSSNTQPDTSQQALRDTSAGHSVQMTVRGPIVADEDFRSYQITASAVGRTLTTYSGYLDQPVDSRQLGNNVKAYEEFVYALDKANLTKGTPLDGDKDDTRGICATGKVYEFTVLNGTDTVKHLWTSTCKGSQGSLKASVAQLDNLFLAQIPDHQSLLTAIKLSD